MAAFDFTVQQVSFPSDDFPEDSSSIDSLSSVVDPNVDFTFEKDTADGKDYQSNYTLFSLKEDSREPLNREKPVDIQESPVHSVESTLERETYPTIPLAVAEYMNKKNPDIFKEAEKYLNLETLKKSSIPINMCTMPNANSSSSPLHSMSITSGALALQQSVIGNYGVQPVSADIVAEVVASTKDRIKQGTVSSAPIPQQVPEKQAENSQSVDKDNHSVLKLIRYPSESISSTVEKRSWFSSSPVEVSNQMSPVMQVPVKENQLSRTCSQTSINSLSLKKNHGTSSIPRVHLSKGSSSKELKNYILDDANYPYEVYPDSSVDYETESSISEKFEEESLYSEAFETESNLSEVSNLDNEIFHFKKSKQNSKFPSHSERMVSSGTQAGVMTSHAYTSPIKSTAKCAVLTDKAVETDDSFQLQILREKAVLEGRLESVSHDQSSLVKERDHFRSLVNSLEAQLKSVQNQLNTTSLEKKNALQLLESQKKEQKNWDNVIKEYQNIIESKNNEIKGLKEDLSESERANTQSKISYEELRVEMESKEGGITGLKKKIAELHVEVQIMLQGKIQLENEVKNVRLEMETLQKSKEWFQEQLHSTQESRNKLHQELIALQSNLVSTSNNLDKVTMERNQVRQELMQTQHRAVAEKEVLMKHLETIEADMKERESMFDEIQKDKGTAESVLIERIRKLEEEKSLSTNLSLTLSDLEYQMKVLRTDCEEKENLIATLKKEKVEFTKQIAILQKTYNDKDMMNQQLHQQIKDLDLKIRHSEMALAHAEELISTLKEERTATDVALASANEEKRLVNESLKFVSENLSKFQHNFKIMKADLVTKTSQAEQLLKEKLTLEEALRKSEDSVLTLRNEYEQQIHFENKNRNVMLDDLKKKKSDVESVLNVYNKDLINYQQTIENLTKMKNSVEKEVADLKLFVDSEKNKVTSLAEENELLKSRISELEDLEQNHINKISEFSKDNVQNSEDAKKTQLLLRTKKVLYKKLKEKMKECDSLKHELMLKNSAEVTNSDLKDHRESCVTQEDLSIHQQRVQELEEQLEELKRVKDEQALLLKQNEEAIIELEREKGKASGFADKYNNLKQHLSELEKSLGEKDSEIIHLQSDVRVLKDQLAELDASLKSQISSLESDLNKEKALVKSLRQQVFQEKRINSRLQRDISTMKAALELANQIADSKRQEVESLQAELSVKMQAEFKHRAELEYYQTEICLQQSIAEKLNKELEEVKARDPALAEQIKALSWKLKEKTNEVTAYKEKLALAEERSRMDLENLKKQMQDAVSEAESVKAELKSVREEKFSYQNKVIELRKALKSKLGELESKGILRMNTENGTIVHLNVPDPEVSFDEAYVNDLLQKSMHLAESRPLSNLQECLNSLKEEMVQLQKKIIENSEAS